MTEAIEIVRGLAEDAAWCGEKDCWDHDVSIKTAVTAIAWLEDGMKMLALDIKAKTEEIEQLRAALARYQETLDTTLVREVVSTDEIDRLRAIKEAARELLDDCDQDSAPSACDRLEALLDG